MEPESPPNQQEETPQTVDFLLNLQEVRRIQKFLPQGVFLQVVKNAARNRKTRVSNLSKRHPEPVHAPKQKRRAYTEAERTIRGTSELFNKCQRILDILKREEDIDPFLDPVDPVELEIPDYPEIIKNPMDLGTIETKLRGHQYDSPEEFNADMRLVWANCMTYNNEDTDIHQMAKEFSEKFERLLQNDYTARKPVKPQNQLIKSSSEVRNEDITTNKPTPVTKKLNTMSYEEKKRLSDMIRKLPQNYLWGVWEIVSEGNVEKQNEELEFDIETLSTETAKKLEKYVQEMFNKMQGQTQDVLGENQDIAPNNDPNIDNNVGMRQEEVVKPDLETRQRFDLDKPNSDGGGNVRSNFGVVDNMGRDLSGSSIMSGLNESDG